SGPGAATRTFPQETATTDGHETLPLLRTQAAPGGVLQAGRWPPGDLLPRVLAQEGARLQGCAERAHRAQAGSAEPGPERHARDRARADRRSGMEGGRVMADGSQREFNLPRHLP